MIIEILELGRLKGRVSKGKNRKRKKKSKDSEKSIPGGDAKKGNTRTITEHARLSPKRPRVTMAGEAGKGKVAAQILHKKSLE